MRPFAHCAPHCEGVKRRRRRWRNCTEDRRIVRVSCRPTMECRHRSERGSGTVSMEPDPTNVSSQREVIPVDERASRPRSARPISLDYRASSRAGSRARSDSSPFLIRVMSCQSQRDLLTRRNHVKPSGNFKGEEQCPACSDISSSPHSAWFRCWVRRLLLAPPATSRPIRRQSASQSRANARRRQWHRAPREGLGSPSRQSMGRRRTDDVAVLGVG